MKTLNLRLLFNSSILSRVPKPSFAVTKMMTSGTKGNVNWSFDIEVHASDLSGNPGKGEKYSEDITDDILETINSFSNKATLRSYGMANALPSVDDFDVSDIGSDVYFVSKISIPFSSRVTLS